MKLSIKVIKTLLFLLFFNLALAQNNTIYTYDFTDKPTKKKITFTQFQVAIPLQRNEDYGELLQDGSRNNNWFLPDGINANIGYGIHLNKWIGISANGGIGMVLSQKMIATPFFTNLRIMPKIGDETRLGIELGLGHAFALGRGNLSGTFQRAKLGLETDNLQIFLEVASYGFKVHNNSQASLCLGISLLTF